MSPAPRTIEVTIDGRKVAVPEGSTLLDACRALAELLRGRLAK